MHFLIIILALTALTAPAWAIDIHDYPDESHCKGDYAAHRDVNPDICINGGHWGAVNSGIRSSSFGFYAIPKDWRISTRSHKGDICKEVAMVIESNGATWVCHGDKKPQYRYTGAGYSFINDKKREAWAADGPKECRGPDALVYKDGPTYELNGADEADVKIMVSGPTKKFGREGANRFCSERYPNHRT